MPTLVGLETHEHQTNQFHSGANGYSIITTSPIDGTAHGRLVGAASAAYVLYNSAGDPPSGIVVGSIICRFTALTLPAAGSIITAVQCFFSNGIGIGIDSNGNWVYQGQSSVSGADAPLAMVLNQLYRIDFTLNVTASPWTITATVTPVSSPTDTTGTPTSLGTGLGSYAANPTGLSVRAGNTIAFTGTFEYTNYIWSFTAADYPLGPCSGRGYSPNAVGTHNLDAATSQFYFSHIASDVALTTSETTSYQNIDELPVGSGTDDVRVIPGSSSTSGQSSTGATTAAAVTGSTWTSITNAQGAPQNAIGTAAGTTNAASGTPAKSGSLQADLSGWSGITGDTVTALTVKARGAFSAVGGTGTQIRCDVYNGATLAATGTAQTPSVATFQDYTFTFTGLSVPVGSLTIRVSYLRGNTNTAYTAYLDGAALSAVTTTAAAQPSAAYYAEYDFAPESTLTVAPAAVKVDVVADLNSAVASTWRAALFDANQGTNTEDIVNNTAFATAAKTYLFKFFNQRPNAGGAWTLAAFNALRLRYGLTAAASGGPRLDGAVIEAIFFPVTTTPKSGSDSGAGSETSPLTSGLTSAELNTTAETAVEVFLVFSSDTNGATVEGTSIVTRTSINDTDTSQVATETVKIAIGSTDSNSVTTEASPLSFKPTASDSNSAVTEANSLTVPLANSDTNSATTEIPALTVPVPVTDSNSVTTEASVLLNKETVTEANGVTTEAQNYLFPLAVIDTDSAVVEPTIITVPISSTDSGVVADSGSVSVGAVGLSSSDANGPVTEVNLANSVFVLGDSGSINEASTEIAPIVSSDSNSVTFNETALIKLSQSDSNGITVESGNQTFGVSSLDTNLVTTESMALKQVATFTDTNLATTESTASADKITDTEINATTEDIVLTDKLSATDVNQGVTDIANAGVGGLPSSTDSGNGSESTPGPLVAPTASDAGSSLEPASTRILFTSADAGIDSEIATEVIHHIDSELGLITEQIVEATSYLNLDQGSGSDLSKLALFVADQASALELQNIISQIVVSEDDVGIDTDIISKSGQIDPNAHLLLSAKLEQAQIVSGENRPQLISAEQDRPKLTKAGLKWL